MVYHIPPPSFNLEMLNTVNSDLSTASSISESLKQQQQQQQHNDADFKPKLHFGYFLNIQLPT